MKLRNGLVSNSSSSSFVLLGFDASGFVKDEDIHELRQKVYFNYLTEGWEGGAPNGVEIVVGLFVMTCSDDGDYPDREFIDLEEILKKVAVIKNKLNVKDRPLGLWKGVMSS